MISWNVFITNGFWRTSYDSLWSDFCDGLAQISTRPAYYPGAKALYDRFVAAHPEAWQSDNADLEGLPWAYVRDVDATNSADIVFQTEPFCSLMSETALDAAGTEAFIAEAVRFANDAVWGTLTAVIVVHPPNCCRPCHCERTRRRHC